MLALEHGRAGRVRQLDDRAQSQLHAVWGDQRQTRELGDRVALGAGIAHHHRIALAALDGLRDRLAPDHRGNQRSEEHTSELQSLMRISYAVFCLKKKNTTYKQHTKSHNRHYIYIISP